MSRNNKPPVVIPAPEMPDEQTLPVTSTPLTETPVETPVVSSVAAKTTHTRVIMPTTEKETFKNPGDVDFVVHYPEAYKGDRNMEQDSTVVISQEVADHFIKLGIGKIKK